MPAGATSMCVIWGPVVGARVLKYRTALSLQILCQLCGTVVFGPHELLPYSGIIKPSTRSSFAPDLVIYALLCATATLQLWHLLAFWRKVPISPFTALGEADNALSPGFSQIAITLHMNLSRDAVMQHQA